MVQITFIEHNGTAHVADVQTGISVMEGARRHDIPGIEADCGGASACATCQVYVAPEWRAMAGDPSEQEAEMLEYSENFGEGSRLSCQIQVTDALDGLVVSMPASQF